MHRRKGTASAARAAFERAYDAIVADVGRGPMSADDIGRIGARLFGRKWAGVAPSSHHWPARPDRYFVSNTAGASSGGVHWIGLYRSPRGQVYVFDSFGRHLPRIIPRLARDLAGEGHGPAVDVNVDQIQSDGTDVCGQLSLAWLSAVHGAGLEATKKLLAWTPEERHALAAAVRIVYPLISRLIIVRHAFFG
jgi:hypothetical protein